MTQDELMRECCPWEEPSLADMVRATPSIYRTLTARMIRLTRKTGGKLRRLREARREARHMPRTP